MLALEISKQAVFYAALAFVVFMLILAFGIALAFKIRSIIRFNQVCDPSWDAYKDRDGLPIHSARGEVPLMYPLPSADGFLASFARWLRRRP